MIQIICLILLLKLLDIGDDMAKRTTIKKLQKDMCYCLKADEDIPLSKCLGVECHRFKSCMIKSNNDIDKDMKKIRNL